jgi:putative FmdB family regulatory protein
MPTYEYRCAKCGQHVEVFQLFSEAPLTKHQGCGGKLTKVLSPAGIVLKGSGFYKTDNRSTSSKKKTTTGADGSGTSDATTGSPSDGAGSKDSSAAAASSSKPASDAKSA